MNDKRKRLVELLIKRGKASMKRGRDVSFAEDPEADKLVKDLNDYPHAFVLACLMDRQYPAKRVWAIPYRLRERLGTFEFGKLVKIPQSTFGKVMGKRPALHRLHKEMAKNCHKAVRRIADSYKGNAANIWNDNPSSATLVRRFLEFDGVGPKIGTMSANLLVRFFDVKVKDYYSIDISPDVQIRRVLFRLGFIPKGASPTYVTYVARELSPTYPGVFDWYLWEHGRDICRPKKPKCSECELMPYCKYYKNGFPHSP